MTKNAPEVHLLQGCSKTLPEAQWTQKLTPWLNLTTSWRHLHYLQIWPPDGATCISCKFGHLHWRRIWSLVANLATKFKIWSSGGATCIGSNVVHRHQVGSHALPHCLELPYWHYQLVLSWYLHQQESHQLSLNKVSQWRTDGHPDPKIGPQVYLGPIKILMKELWFIQMLMQKF